MIAETDTARAPRVASSLGSFIGAAALFLLSGGAGLLYQVVWTRKLVLLFGTTSYAVSTVLSVFFLGLAIGSVWGGRLADRSKRPLRIYGVMELGIAAWAVVFLFAIGFGESVVVELLRLAGGARGLGIALRTFMAAAFLIVPVTLMGATLPLLARYVTSGPVSPARIGWLYSINTFGAVLGCATAGFVLLPALGYTRATFVGAGINLAVGLAAFVLDRGRNTTNDIAPVERSKVSLRLSWGARGVVLAFAVSGFAALGLEVVWTRLLTLVFLGTTYSFTTMLTTVLCGIAAGGAVASLVSGRVRQPVLAFGLVQILTGAGCIAALALFPGLPARLQEMQLDGGYEWRSVVIAKFLLSFLALFGPTFLFGLSFPMALNAFARESSCIGRDVGRLYAWNTLGGVLGSLAGGFLFIPLLGTQNSIIGLAALVAVAGLALVFVSKEDALPRRRAWAIAGAAAVGVAVLVAPRDVSLALNQSYLPQGHTLLHYTEGVEGTVAVSGPKDDPRGSDRVLWINAVQATATIEKGVKMNRFQGMLPFLFDRDIERVLFMCFGSGITAGTLSLNPVERIDAVEISPDVVGAAPYFASDNFGVIDSPRVRVIVDDGRNYLLRTEEKYDLITFEPMPLALAGVSTFYTAEYYRLCRDRLADGGLVSQWIPLHNGLDLETVRGLFATFVDTFPESTAWFINADMFLIGSNKPLRVDYAAIERRLAENDTLRAALDEVYLPDIPELLAAFFMDKDKLAAFAGDAPRMSDDRPWAEFIAPKLIFERNVADLLAALQPYRESVLPLLALPEGARGDAIREAVLRRHRAHMQDMEGLKVYYGSGPLASPEKQFRMSLEIDPNDANARYYIVEVLLARGRMFTAWEELDKAIPLLEEARKWGAHRLEVQLALGDAYAAADRAQDARAAYRSYMDLGGRDPRAAEAVGSAGSGS